MDFAAAHPNFYQDIQGLDSELNLARVALWIAQAEYSALDIEEYLAALDTMAEELKERLPDAPYPLKILKAINHYLFQDLGFCGNTNHYYDPRNSFLNEVIDRRVGIPITLSLIYLEVAKRIDFPMVGIGMPGHFLIRPDFPECEMFVDPFHQGEILFPEDCQLRLEQLYAKAVPMQPDFLDPVSSRQILIRLLTNLKTIYLQHSDPIRCLGIIEKILLLTPNAFLEWRDHGLLCYQLGRLPEAKYDLETFFSHLPSDYSPPSINLVRQILETIRSS